MSVETHESYAQISASRVTSTDGVSMYGSKLKHSRYITLTISESELHRAFTQDRYHDGKQLIRVRLSENQFASFITSLNCGGGTPCTIERLNMKKVPEPPFYEEVSVAKSEFEAKAKEVASALADAQKRLAAMLVPGGKASKADLNLLREDMEKAVREIGANMPYMADCFHETMDDVVTAAKTDIEAYASDAFARAGVTGLSAPVQLAIEEPGLQPEYRTFEAFAADVQSKGWVVDRSVQEVLDKEGDLVGSYHVRESGIVLYRNL